MRKYEDFTIDDATIAASGVVEKYIKDQFIKALEPKLVVSPLLPKDNLLQREGGSTRRFQFTDRMSEPKPFNAGSEVPGVTKTVGPTYKDFAPELFGMSETIYAQAIKKADFAVMNMVKARMVDAYARGKNTRILKGIRDANGNFAGVTNPTKAGILDVETEGALKENATTGVFEVDPTTEGSWEKHAIVDTENWQSLSYNKTIKVHGLLYHTSDDFASATAKTMGTGTAQFQVDYNAGEIYFNTAPTSGDYFWIVYERITRSTVEPATADFGSLNYVDAVAAQTAIGDKYGVADNIVMNHRRYDDLLRDDKFIDAQKGGQFLQGQPFVNGKINHFAGLDVLVDQVVDDSYVPVLKKGAELGYDVVLEPISTKVETLQKTTGDQFLSVWENTVPAILQPDLIVIVLNCSPYSKKYV